MVRLMNLGNTCYINSAVSIIYSIHELCDYIDKTPSDKSIEGYFIRELNEVFALANNPKLIISPGKYIQFNKQLYKSKQKIDFMQNSQCDSTEYLLFVFECISSCHKKIIPLLCESINTITYTSDDGLYVDTIVETDLIRYICIPNKQKVSLEECIEYTYADESITKLNEKTNKQQTYTKHTTITKNPSILILQYNKRGVIIKAPDILNMSPYSTIPDTYELFGIINHVGNTADGHYYTFIKESSGWFIYDDAIKKPLVTMESQHNYCMFYRKIK